MQSLYPFVAIFFVLILPSSCFGQVSLSADSRPGNACAAQGGGEWLLRNNTNDPHSVVLFEYYSDNGIASNSLQPPIPLGPQQVRSLGCSRSLSNGHLRTVSYGIREVDGKPLAYGNPQGSPQGGTPPPPPPQPFPYNDPSFKYLGDVGFGRRAGGTALTQAMWVFVVLDKGMEVDTSYRQVDERRGWQFTCCIGHATSPLTVDQIPPGFLVEMEGSNYFSARDPQVIPQVAATSSILGLASGSVSTPAFTMTLYCGPPAHAGCSVRMRVWVKQRAIPKS